MDSFDMSLLASSIVPNRMAMAQDKASDSVLSTTDTLQALHRQTVYLQREIQDLLDAQSIGLMAGLGYDTSSDEDRPPSGKDLGPIHLPVSSSSSAKSKRISSGDRGSRRPPLPTTRNRLQTSMVQLGNYKKNEAQALEMQCGALKLFVTDIDELAQKKSKIESAVYEIEQSTDGNQQSLAEEEQSLTTQISDLETRLQDARSRLNHIQRERREASNRKAAQLSSWQGALLEIDQKIQREVLADNALVSISSTKRSRQNGKDINVWSLPKERRSVAMVREDADFRIQALDKRKEMAMKESSACNDGAEIWMNAIKKIVAIETLLADELDGQSKRQESDNHVESTLARVLQSMKDTELYLENENSLAEDKGWNLLVCILGAELEAMRQAEELLQDTLQSTRTGNTTATASMMTAQSRFASDLSDKRTPHDKAFQNDHQLEDHRISTSIASMMDHNGSGSLDAHTQQQDHDTRDSEAPDAQMAANFDISPSQTARYRDHDSEDDDPGPELLISPDS